jgi:hypothetical protein
MQKDERDLLEVLNFELKFLEDGGYGRSPKSPWRPQYIFEDSLTCMNYYSKENPAPCNHCVLMQLVPPEHRSEKIPCRHIPFNESGDTLESLYRYSSQIEIEETVADWLRSTIRFLEEQREVIARTAKKHEVQHPLNVRGMPLYEKHHPKCANPACPTAFHWTGGGKFFRFRPDSVAAKANNAETDAPAGIHGVRHYWLCERCSQVFTLVYDPEFGVVLKSLWPELSGAAGSQKKTTAA